MNFVVKFLQDVIDALSMYCMHTLCLQHVFVLQQTSCALPLFCMVFFFPRSCIS